MIEPGLARWSRVLPKAMERIAFENEILAVGAEHLPKFARDVLDGQFPSDAYWNWLTDLWLNSGP